MGGCKRNVINRLYIDLFSSLGLCIFSLGGIVKAINDSNTDINIIFSCCRHHKMPGSIYLSDGRILGVFADREEWDKWVRQPKETIYGELMKNNYKEGK